jgi:rod shape-determining protein MreC
MNWSSRNRPWTFLFLLALTVLILALHETGQLKLLEDGLSLVTGPIQRALSGAAKELGQVFSSVGDVQELQARVDELQVIANDLAAENIRAQEIEAENAQLRDLLNFVSAHPSLRGYIGGDIIGQSGLFEAEIVGYDTNPFVFYVIVNRGGQDELRVGMPVIVGGGRLVGRIAEVRPRWSKVQLLIDPGSQVNGVVQGSRAAGLITGQPDGTLSLEQVSQSEQVNVGDTVVTSGQGGLLPKGLIVGQVTEVEQRDIDLYQRATLRPAVEYRRLDIVLVITDFEPIAVDETPEE